MENNKALLHRITVTGSVQALVIDDDILFAGLDGGLIAAYSLDTFDLVSQVQAHEDSVLGLDLCAQQELLFTTTQHKIAFRDRRCVLRAYSARTSLAFFGAQNGSLSWYRVPEGRNGVPVPETPFSPVARKHRFFDSFGPGGTQDPLQLRGPNGTLKVGGRRHTVHLENYQAYSHKSYVFAMVLAKGLFQHDAEEEVLITGGGGGTIKLWRIEATSSGVLELFKLRNKGLSVLSLAYSGSFLYAGLSGGVVHIYNLSSCQLVHKLRVGQDDVLQTQISCGSVIAGSSGGLLTQFNSQFSEVASWQAHNGKILASYHSHTPSRKILATGGNDNTIAIWDPKDPEATSVAQAVQSDDELLKSLRQFIGYQTVSVDPRHARDCHEAANFLRKLCNAFGATATVLSPAGQEGVSPILLAKFRASAEPEDSKTILFYGHYDVVGAEMSVNAKGRRNWYADPFSLTPLNGFFYGRGVSDNKGPILAALYAVADLVQQSRLSCNVTFLLEGDEEAGSRGFRPTVQQHHDLIGPVNHILLSNSYWLDDHVPCLTFGMRGVVHATVNITSSRQADLHSGMDGKAVQHEPLKDLTVLLSTILGPNGTDITIPGFNGSIDKLTDGESAAYNQIASSLLAGHPEIKSQQEFAQSLMQRWRYPNLTIHQISVPEAKTAVTISRTAQATLSIRIVPSQTAEEVATSLTAHLEKSFAKLHSNNKLEVRITAKADPWLGNPRSPLFQSLRSAIVDVWNPESDDGGRSFPDSASRPPDPSISEIISPVLRPPHRRASTLASSGTFTSANTPHEPLFIREGGSIPAISFLEKEFGADAAMFPMGQASDNAHLDNERIRVENLKKGGAVLKRVFGML
ncbi:putative di- and tripeptidase DUG2 [Cyphellophora attinorum]|uniref:Putative di-and tripeptidase DUG2 n=1 Tax=Cyphellophora attinorum TaxID=1664694 RepID=A0A0N1H2P8_9EURO|nr:putative di- and tripeptidase DUG2 [Phialophora attinorum]KPI34446.1 putative di- and tripeptidase DUG2 [Phialophora attinorum]